MSKTLLERLDAMAADPAGKSQTARLRAVFGHVEKALNAGVRRQAVLEALHQDGFTFSMQTFEKALYRIRKSQRAKPASKSTVSQSKNDIHGSTSPVQKNSSTTAPQATQSSLTPADFREIRNKDHDWLALSQPVADQ